MKKYIFGVLLALISLTIICPTTVMGQNVKTFIPPNAFKYMPMYKERIFTLAPETKYPEYYFGLTEHESCISLKASKCFNPESELLTDREQGTGLGQITRTYNKDGTVRFDSLKDLRDRHMKELKDLSWSNVKQRPDLQMDQIILMTGDNLKQFYMIDDEYIRYQFADVAYNGGAGHTKKERLQCGLTAGCNPKIWFGNVANIKTVKSLKPIYGDRSPWDINRHHAEDVFYNRMPKYVPYMKKE